MVKALWVLPSLDPEYRAQCLATLKVPHLLVVNNAAPNRNTGVTAAWNLGINAARGIGARWVVFLSESMRFGDHGGLDFEDGLAGVLCDGLFGWHMVGVRLDVIDRVGLFDPNLESYLGETDYLVRLHWAGYPSPRENNLPGRVQRSDIDAWHTGTEHSIIAGLATPDLGAAHLYFSNKWGCPEPHPRWQHPFNDPTKDWSWYPMPPDPRSILID